MIRTCESCGEEFYTSLKAKRFCGLVCQERDKWERQNARRRLDPIFAEEVVNACLMHRRAGVTENGTCMGCRAEELELLRAIEREVFSDSCRGWFKTPEVSL